MTATATLTDVPQSSMPQHLRQSQPILSRVRKQLQVQLPKLTPIAFWNLHDKYVADQRRIDPDAGNLQQLAIGSLGLCVLIIGTLWYLLAIGG